MLLISTILLLPQSRRQYLLNSTYFLLKRENIFFLLHKGMLRDRAGQMAYSRPVLKSTLKVCLHNNLYLNCPSNHRSKCLKFKHGFRIERQFPHFFQCSQECYFCKVIPFKLILEISYYTYEQSFNRGCKAFKVFSNLNYYMILFLLQHTKPLFWLKQKESGK